jgi:hypothetical protein
MNYREENEKSQKTIDRINERWRKAGKLSSKTIFGNDADAVAIVNVANDAMADSEE